MARNVNTNADDRSRVEREQRTRSQDGADRRADSFTTVRVERDSRTPSKNSIADSVRAAAEQLRLNSSARRSGGGIGDALSTAATQLRSGSSAGFGSTPSGIAENPAADIEARPTVSSSSPDVETGATPAAAGIDAAPVAGVEAEAARVPPVSPGIDVESGYGQTAAAAAPAAEPRRRRLVRNEVGDVVDTETGEIVYSPPTPERSYRFMRTGLGEVVDRKTGEVVYSPSPSTVSRPAPRGQEAPKQEQAPAGSSRARENVRPGGGFSTRGSGTVPVISADDVAEAEEATAREDAAQNEIDNGTPNFAVPIDESAAPDEDGVWGFMRIPDEIADIEDSAKRVEEAARYIQDQAGRQAYRRYAMAMGDDGSDLLDEYGRARDYSAFEDIAYGDDEKVFERERAQQRATALRFYNPSALHIEGERLEFKTEIVNGRKVVYARRVYDDSRIERAIGTIRRLYNCTTGNVMQTVMCRAGLGVGRDGTIAHVDPDKFYLTKDQFFELCRDIYNAQNNPVKVKVDLGNGEIAETVFPPNPLGPVAPQAAGSGVRDETGRYVVVAKTRCYPLGYMPKQLIEDLRRDWNSPLHGMSSKQIAGIFADQWLMHTYPTICANPGGNLMYQQRAIENMMRGLMSIDGADPAGWGIPEIVVNHNMMVMQAERYGAKDPQIMEANEVRYREQLEAKRRIEHRYLKGRKAARDSDGRIVSRAERRRQPLGDFLRALSVEQRVAGSLRTVIMATSPLEAMQAIGEQGLANMVTEGRLAMMDSDVAASHKMTDELNGFAGSKEAASAMGVYMSLYRIGGWTAIDAFNGDGYPLTKAGLATWLEDYGIVGESLSEKARRLFGNAAQKEGRKEISAKDERGFIAFAQSLVDKSDDVFLGSSNLFKGFEAKQFVKMSLTEMAEFQLQGARETYTSDDVAEWARADGAAEMIRSLMMTPAGREAFMTQGVTSLDRKSPWEHAARRLLTANGATEFAFRTFICRFAEYKVQKILRTMPLTNTISYCIAYTSGKAGDKLEAGALKRVADYQMGAQYKDFFIGLRKNLLYDAIMTGSRFTMALIIKQILLGFGLIPPEEEDLVNTASEWRLGDEESSLPIKLAWYMDDMFGVSYPLGIAWAIAEQGGYSPDSVATASKVFINAAANFQDGADILDAIDLVRNWPEKLGDFLDGTEDPRDDVAFQTKVALFALDVLGDSCPAIIGEWLVPWSRDWLFSGDELEHTSSYVYDPAYSREQAVRENRYSYVDDPNMRALRYAAMNNWVAAVILDFAYGHNDPTGRRTSFKYADMPVATQQEARNQLAESPYNRFYLDQDDLPADNDERLAAMDEAAMDVLAYIDEKGYQNSAQAINDGFVLNVDARDNAWAYAQRVIDQLKIDKKSLRYDDHRYGNLTWDSWDEFNAILISYETEISKYYWYKDLLSDIPSREPVYLVQKTDYETKYVNDRGEAGTFVDALPKVLRDPIRGAQSAIGYGIGSILGLGSRLGLPGAQEGYSAQDYADAMAASVSDDGAHHEEYAYGNQPSAMPWSSPRTEGKGYNYETIANWVRFDDEGNPITDTGAVFDELKDAEIVEGPNKGKNFGELEWGGQGSNLQDDVAEQLNIPPDGIPTANRRNLVADNRRLPFSDEDDKGIYERFGVTLPETSDAGSDDGDGDGGSGGGSYSYGGSWYPRYYGGYSYSGGGGGSYEYNPRIYSNSKQVYSDRASGMSTRQPYSPQRTYLHPGFYTIGSRKAYSRQQ